MQTKWLQTFVKNIIRLVQPKSTLQSPDEHNQPTVIERPQGHSHASSVTTFINGGDKPFMNGKWKMKKDVQSAGD